MARFDLSKYATVAERLAKFHEDYPDGRITTTWESSYAIDGAGPNIWVVKSYLYLTAGDQANNLPKATGHAFEIDGTGGANNGSALENAESSSIGRCLMVAGYSMNKDPNSLASRQEIEKVERISNRDWVADADKITDIVGLRWLYAEAKSAGVSQELLERIESRGKVLSASGEGQGTDRGVPDSPKK